VGKEAGEPINLDMSTRIRIIFYLMMASFIFFREVFVPVLGELLSGSVTFLLPLTVFFFVG